MTDIISISPGTTAAAVVDSACSEAGDVEMDARFHLP
jgi:hypothetical protein